MEYQIWYDMKRRVIAEDRAIWLKAGLFWSTLSNYTINFLWLCFPRIKRNILEIFEHVQKVKKVCDSLQFLESWQIVL